MEKLEYDIVKSWIGDTFIGGHQILTGMTVTINTNIIYSLNEDTEYMNVDVGVNMETGRVVIDIHNMPPYYGDPSLSRHLLKDIITVLTVAEQVATQMEAAIKGIDPAALAEYRKAVRQLDDDAREAKKRREQGMKQVTQSALEEYIKVLANKEYTITMANDAEAG